ncbi:MAG TPA: RNA-protein complex protein Nop10 [Methanothermococcus okinawensis]|uniref:Ribosome biogenesis protein Nop10 n=1 Tax=Methanothermococcus okinawensis TaxID=155863 RepID=A0A833DZN3_9EURY|nr:RNA-protein complex protein Nop10 [Methanothermococcus okinawensis]HIP91808.1 RNA-protein complex protein Nop10 [Methanothermococcus okinawensis]
MRIKKCPKCKRYTLKDICSICGEKTVTVKPPKFSLEDRYGKYRRMLKRKLKHGEKY